MNPASQFYKFREQNREAAGEENLRLRKSTISTLNIFRLIYFEIPEISANLFTQRNELIKTTKRVLLSTFLVIYAKFLVEVRKRFCCV